MFLLHSAPHTLESVGASARKWNGGPILIYAVDANLIIRELQAGILFWNVPRKNHDSTAL